MGLIRKRGDEIEDGATVYYCKYTNSTELIDFSYKLKYVARGIAHHSPIFTWQFIGLIDFYFDPNDGLYTTLLIRNKWKRKPYKHPHATLFDILLQKTMNYTSSE